MIIVVGGIKGGTGKSTIATNLTVLRSFESKKVLLVDADEQGSSSMWSNQRDAQDIPTNWTTISLYGKSVYSQILRMKNDYEDIIIDVGGRETQSLRAALAICDIFLIPFKPRSFDVWTLSHLKNLISEMRCANKKMKCYAFINQGDCFGNDNLEAINILSECDEIECLNISIGTRKAFATASSDGLGIYEMKILDKKACQELKDLYDILFIHAKKCEKV